MKWISAAVLTTALAGLVQAVAVVAVSRRCAEARKMTCEDKDERIDKLETDLRLRAAELIVVRSQLRAAEKKLAHCAVDE